MISTSSKPEQFDGTAVDNSELLHRFEINCDMGEGFGPWKMGDDASLMPLIDSANIACGGHAGDPRIMMQTVKLAKKHGVKVGAHPGLPDLVGFGRRQWAISPEDVYNMVLYQVGALKAFLDAEDIKMSYIKPHGELYFYIERDSEVMKAVLKAAKVFDVPVMGAKSSRYERVAHSYGIKFIQEVYPDLNYSPEGFLKKILAGPKSIRTPEMIADCISRAGIFDEVFDTEDSPLNLNFNGSPISFCLHSDMPGSVANAQSARKAVDEVNKAKNLTLKPSA